MSPGILSRLLGATEADLRARQLGIVRLVVPLPFGQTGGDANVYLIDNPDGSLTMFDAGIGTREALEALEAGFAEAGRRIEEVSRLVVSHGHIDHHGAASFVAERSGARVFVHPADHPKVTCFVWPEPVRERHRVYLRRMGLPAPAIAEMEGMERSGSELLGRRLEQVEPLVDGERLCFAHFEAEALHLPGHSAGLVGLHSPAQRLLFSADHLLRGIAPNPLLDLGEKGDAQEYRALVAYFESLSRVERLDVDLVLPGHGEPFGDHRAAVAAVRGTLEKRQERLLDLLRAGSMTPFELVGGESGRRPRRLQLFLRLSEVVGNLEVLEAKGAVQRYEQDGVWRYELAA